MAINFKSPNKSEWIKIVVESIHKIKNGTSDSITITLVFESDVKVQNFDPIHIVLLSCFIDDLKKKNFFVRLQIEDGELRSFIFNDVNIKKYWGVEPLSYIDSPIITDLNLWRISDSDKESYSISIHNYFKRRYFKGYDLSAFKNSLNELYSNVFDHADASGNAFSYIRYDEENRKIKVAVCDFGKGVASTLRKQYPEFENDENALRNSIEAGISARTQKHNKGFGLNNITTSLSQGDEFRLFSNTALLLIKDGMIQTWDTSDEIKADFRGSLIYFDISIDNFEKEEFIDNFDF